jgi:hypothetical protein
MLPVTRSKTLSANVVYNLTAFGLEKWKSKYFGWLMGALQHPHVQNGEQ